MLNEEEYQEKLELVIDGSTQNLEKYYIRNANGIDGKYDVPSKHFKFENIELIGLPETQANI